MREIDNSTILSVVVGEVSYVELFNDENNRPRGCAVIEFESAELAHKAVDTMHRYELKGRKLVVKEVSSLYEGNFICLSVHCKFSLSLFFSLFLPSSSSSSSSSSILQHLISNIGCRSVVQMIIM